LWWFFWFTWPFLGLLAVHRALLGRLSVSGRIVWFPFLVALAVAVFGLGVSPAVRNRSGLAISAA
jgi:hypothetical protein